MAGMIHVTEMVSGLPVVRLARLVPKGTPGAVPVRLAAPQTTPTRNMGRGYPAAFGPAVASTGLRLMYATGTVAPG